MMDRGSKLGCLYTPNYKSYLRILNNVVKNK